MVLILSFINVMHHIDWFADVEPPLQPRNNLHVVMVNNPFNVLLDPISYYFGANFCIHVHPGDWSVILLFGGFYVWFWDQGSAGFIEWVWRFSFRFYFLKELQKNRYKFFLKCLVEFPWEVMWPWTLDC